MAVVPPTDTKIKSASIKKHGKHIKPSDGDGTVFGFQWSGQLHAREEAMNCSAEARQAGKEPCRPERVLSMRGLLTLCLALFASAALFLLSAPAQAQNQGVSITFENPGTQTIEVFWVNGGQETQYGSVGAGKIKQQQSYPGHLWRFKQSGRTVSEYRASSAGSQKHRIVTPSSWAWMEGNANILGNEPLNSLVLIGTHDAATYELEWVGTRPVNDVFPADANEWLKKTLASTIGPVFLNWARAQDRTVYQQLKDGVRLIDLRVCVDKQNRMMICHGAYGPPLSEVLEDIKRFAAEAPREIVILDFMHFYVFDGVSEAARLRDLESMVIATLGSHMIPNPANNGGVKPSSLLNEFWSTGKQLIVIFKETRQSADAQRLMWNRGDSYQYIWKSGDDRDTKIDLFTQQINAWTANPDPDKFFGVPLAITPSHALYGRTADVAGNTPGSLEGLADQTNPVTLSYMLNEWRPKKINIFAMDHYHKTCAILVAKYLNGIPVTAPNTNKAIRSVAQLEQSCGITRDTPWGRWASSPERLVEKAGSILGVTPDDTYTLTLNCHHDDLSNTKTDNRITVSFFSGSSFIGSDYKNGSGPCLGFNKTFSVRSPSRQLTRVEISTNGGDGFFIDNFWVEKGGTRLLQKGGDDGRGWCLSTEAGDAHGSWKGYLAGNRCKSTWSFNVPHDEKAEVVIDCDHSELSHEGTANFINVMGHFKGSPIILPLQPAKPGASNAQCEAGSLVYEVTLGPNQSLSHVEISTTGDDGFFIDMVDLRQAGRSIRKHGADEYNGWCLSTDPQDAFGSWKGRVGSCQEVLTFNY